MRLKVLVCKHQVFDVGVHVRFTHVFRGSSDGSKLDFPLIIRRHFRTQSVKPPVCQGCLKLKPNGSLAQSLFGSDRCGGIWPIQRTSLFRSEALWNSNHGRVAENLARRTLLQNRNTTGAGRTNLDLICLPSIQHHTRFVRG